MTALGIVAGVLTTASFLPQVIRSARLKSAHSFSWLWLVCFGAGVSAWLAYGLVLADPAIIGANAVTLLAVLALIALRIRHRAEAAQPDAFHPTTPLEPPLLGSDSGVGASSPRAPELIGEPR